MSQHDYIISNQGFASYRSDHNSSLSAIVSNNSGATEPTTTYAYQWWYDETTDILKMRNADNDAWITMFTFDQTADTYSLATDVTLTLTENFNITGSGTISGDLTVGDDFFVDQSDDRVGVGGTSVVGGGDTNGQILFLYPSGNRALTISTVADGAEFDIGTTNTNLAKDLIFKNGGSESMRIDSSGNVGIGTTSPDGKLNVVGERIVTNGGALATNLSLGGRSIAITGVENLSSSGRAGFVNRIGNDFATINDNAGFMHLYPFSDGDDSYAFRASVGTTLSDTFYVKQQGDAYFSGDVGIGISSPIYKLDVRESTTDFMALFFNDGNTDTRKGIIIQCGSDTGAGTNRPLTFRDGNGTVVGEITFTGGTVTYGPFTAHHPCFLPEGVTEYPYGTLLEIVSIFNREQNGVTYERGIRYNVQKTQSENSKSVLGAYSGPMATEEEPDAHQVYILGDGHILCNNSGGNISIGDGICSSSTAGIGKKATDNPSMIIGIAQENVTFENDTETKLVAVQYGLQQFIPWGN